MVHKDKNHEILLHDIGNFEPQAAKRFDISNKIVFPENILCWDIQASSFRLKQQTAVSLSKIDAEIEKTMWGSSKAGFNIYMVRIVNMFLFDD